MSRAIPFFAGLALAIIVFAATGAQAAATAQMLGIVIDHDTAATERQPFYRSAAPIAVNVRGDARHISAITVIAHGPDGSAVTAPLVRTADGFSGALKLALPGTWTLAMTTQLGSMTTALADVPLDVVAEDNADLAARLAFALSALSLGAGCTVLYRARRAATRFAA